MEIKIDSKTARVVKWLVKCHKQKRMPSLNCPNDAYIQLNTAQIVAMLLKSGISTPTWNFVTPSSTLDAVQPMPMRIVSPQPKIAQSHALIPWINITSQKVTVKVHMPRHHKSIRQIEPRQRHLLCLLSSDQPEIQLLKIMIFASCRSLLEIAPKKL